MRSINLVPQLVGTVGLIFIICNLPGPWNGYRIAGLVLTVIGGAFLLTARYQLGSSFAVKAKATELVTQGIYSRIRNPIYVFSTLMILGTVIAYQRPKFLLIPAGLIVMQIKRARVESRVLEEKFGDAYRLYRSQTWF
jgi:protein-S-isoprenylcysteine O-methyltransferase Ste14